MVERLECKTEIILRELEHAQGNWDETFYRFVAKCFGLHINTDPFLMLARSTPLLLIAKHRDHITQIEALLFGQAGMLVGDFQDDYPRELQKEYLFLSKKYQLKPLDNSLWKFLRLRPSGFPTIRISQFANLMFKYTHVFSKILDFEDEKQMKDLFQTAAGNYWENHYQFDRISDFSMNKHTGEQFINNLLINVVSPFLFAYAIKKGLPKYKERALALLEAIKPEQNRITREYISYGLKCTNALDSQALIQLQKAYCHQKKCLACGIGAKIIQSNTDLSNNS